MDFKSIAFNVWEWLSTILFGVVEDNAWYSANRDIVIGISIVVICAIVFVGVIALLIAILRFLGRLFRL